MFYIALDKIYVLRNNIVKIKTWSINATILIKIARGSHEIYLFTKFYYNFFLIKFMK